MEEVRRTTTRPEEGKEAHVQFILHFYVCHSHNSHFRRYFVQTFHYGKKLKNGHNNFHPKWYNIRLARMLLNFFVCAFYSFVRFTFSFSETLPVYPSLWYCSSPIFFHLRHRVLIQCPKMGQCLQNIHSIVERHNCLYERAGSLRANLSPLSWKKSIFSMHVGCFFFCLSAFSL